MIGQVLGWKFDHAPGIVTIDNKITEWPIDELGSLPTQAELDAWTVEYNDYQRSVAYRQDRRDAYRKNLSQEGTFEASVGEQLDVLIAAVVTGDKTEVTELKAKIDAIKAQFPKPAQSRQSRQ